MYFRKKIIIWFFLKKIAVQPPQQKHLLAFSQSRSHSIREKIICFKMHFKKEPRVTVDCSLLAFI